MTDISLRASGWIRSSTPALLTLVLVLLSAVDFRIPGLIHFVPLVGLISIFYWGVYVPKLIPAWFVFLLGILQDFIYGTPLGISSFVNLLLLWLIVSQRKYLFKETFWVVWGVFSFVVLIFSLLSGTIYSIYFAKYALSNDIFMQWVFTAFLYPFLHKLFNVIQVAFLKA